MVKATERKRARSIAYNGIKSARFKAKYLYSSLIRSSRQIKRAACEKLGVGGGF